MAISKPVAFWDFNDTRVDSVGGLELVSGDGLEHYVDGKIGQGWDANGVLFHLSGLREFAPKNTSFTLSAWVNVTRPGISYSLIYECVSVYQSETERIQMLIWRLNTDQVYVSARVSSGGVTIFTRDTGLLLTNGEWCHIAVRAVQGVGITCFLNGVPGALDARITDLPPITESVRVGGSLFNSVLPGSIDAVGLFTSALTDDQIAELYNSGNGWEYAAKTIIPLMRRYHRQIKD